MAEISIGKYLRGIRKEKGFTLVELSKLSGVSNPYISQIENDKFNPSLDIVRKISNALDTDFYEAAWRAGLITDDEIRNARHQREFYDSLTSEDIEKMQEEDVRWQNKYFNIQMYQERFHVRIEDFLKDERKVFYINDHKLTHDEIKSLITLYGGKEKNYPSDEQIEIEYEEIKKTQEENRRKVNDGEAFFIMDPYYDVNTNEDITNKE